MALALPSLTLAHWPLCARCLVAMEARPAMSLCHQAWLCPPFSVTPVLPGTGVPLQLPVKHKHQPLHHTLCHNNLDSCMPYALSPSPAQPWGCFPAVLPMEGLTAMAVLNHPIRAARSHTRTGDGSTQPCSVQFWGMCPSPASWERGNGPTTYPSPGCARAVLASPGFGLPRVPANVFWGHRIIEL